MYLESLLGRLDVDTTSSCSPASVRSLQVSSYLCYFHLNLSTLQAHIFKEDVEKTINSWKDVDAAVLVSDSTL